MILRIPRPPRTATVPDFLRQLRLVIPVEVTAGHPLVEHPQPLGGAGSPRHLVQVLGGQALTRVGAPPAIARDSRNELPEVFVNHGMPTDLEMDFKLVCRSELNVSDEKCAEMWSVQGFSGDLWQTGFAIIETNTRSLIVLDTH